MQKLACVIFIYSSIVYLLPNVIQTPIFLLLQAYNGSIFFSTYLKLMF